LPKAADNMLKAVSRDWDEWRKSHPAT
jgi:hypothetical protein